MVLSEWGLKESSSFLEKGFNLPQYDRDEMIKKTEENPVWVHFGAGNIFRAFHAKIADQLLNEEIMDKGITVVEGYDYEIVGKKYRPNDNYSILVTLKSDGTVDKDVIGSIAESCILDTENDKEYDRIKEIFKKDSLQIVTFTITEKGYNLTDEKGVILRQVASDFENGPTRPKSYIGKVAALLFERYNAGKKPVAFVSTDNCSHNGDRLYEAMKSFAKAWEEKGLCSQGFLEYICDKNKVSFPWTMIDKITPRPHESVKEMLRLDGLLEVEPLITEKNTYVAPFVNAEETGYLVIEDVFPNGRPPLEKAGVIFTDRDTVDKVEKMKVCTCLNPLHTALAVFGCLLHYKKISDEMKDEDLVKLINNIGYKEGLPVVVDPVVLNPKEFIDTVTKVRLPNPFMPDTPQRIATDTSQKLSVRFGETVKNYVGRGLDTTNLKCIPLVYAGWLRYLMAVDDELKPFELSPDPLLDILSRTLQRVKIGSVSRDGVEEVIEPILQNAEIFGFNLYEVNYGEKPLADEVTDLFMELIQGKGAVRKLIKKRTV